MTDERSYTDCIRPVLGRGGPLQTFDIKPICWSFPTLDHAFAEARKAVLVSPYRLYKHCSASQREGFMTNDPVTQSPRDSSLERFPLRSSHIRHGRDNGNTRR